MNQDEIKKKYGWSSELENFFIQSNPLLKTDYRGSFKIKNHKGKYFWYFQLSRRGKGRDKYLCSVEPKDLDFNEKSFQYSCRILLKKLQSNFIIGSRNETKLSTYIQLYEDFLDTEKHSNYGRTVSTINGMFSNVKDFKRYSIKQNLKLNIVPTNEMKIVIKNYITELKLRELKKSSIKGRIQDVRYFLDYLCKDKLTNGLGLFPSHPISPKLQNELLDVIIGTQRTYVEREFRKEYYDSIYTESLEKIRKIWIDYCVNGKIKRIKDKNGKINQPSHFLGRDVVWFISLLQIRGGFRVGEVLYSYRNRDVFNNFHIKIKPKEMGSFWDKTEDGWVLRIRNSKRKNRDVPFTDTIRSWVEPPSHINCREYNGDKKQFFWDTDLIDVIMELFPVSYYTFPSPNHIEKQNKPRSITYYMNTFREECVLKNNWEKYGVQSTHNLRSFFISYSIRRDDLTPFQISSITGHSISTMEKYYIRENLKSKFDLYKKIPQKGILYKKK